MDSAEQLQRIYLAGFELQTFERYPKCIGVMRDNCVAVLVPGMDGLQLLGTPGWRMGEVMGVLTEKDGRPVFQAKAEIVEATPDRVETLKKFRADLAGLLRPPPTPIVSDMQVGDLPKDSPVVTTEDVRGLDDEES